MDGPTALQWLLRVGVFGTFFGHGFLAVIRAEPKWEAYLAVVGLLPHERPLVMRLIGCIDVAAAFSVLLSPCAPVLAWATAWAFSTALVRPLCGESVFAFIERAANWVVPLALLLQMTHGQAPSACGLPACGAPADWPAWWQSLAHVGLVLLAELAVAAVSLLTAPLRAALIGREASKKNA